MSRADRLVQLMQLLRQHQRPVSAQHLAKALGVSLRSIYRDVEALRAQGAELEGEAGVGYRLKPGLLLPAMVLDEAELMVWLQALHALPAGPQAKAAKSLLAKLQKVLPADLWRSALSPLPTPGPGPRPRAPKKGTPPAGKPPSPSRPARRKGQGPALPWPEAPEALTQWPGLAEAIDQGRQVLLSYGSARRALRELSVRPLAAVQGPQGLQLLGWHPDLGQAKAYDWALIRGCVPQALRVEGDRQELLARWARGVGS